MPFDNSKLLFTLVSFICLFYLFVYKIIQSYHSSLWMCFSEILPLFKWVLKFVILFVLIILFVWFKQNTLPGFYLCAFSFLELLNIYEFRTVFIPDLSSFAVIMSYCQKAWWFALGNFYFISNSDVYLKLSFLHLYSHCSYNFYAMPCQRSWFGVYPVSSFNSHL